MLFIYSLTLVLTVIGATKVSNISNFNLSSDLIRKNPYHKIFFLNGRSNSNPPQVVRSKNKIPNFYKAGKEINMLVESYKICLSRLSLNDLSENSIQSCTGIDEQFFKNDVNYIEMKIIAQVERKIRSLFIEMCYKAVKGHQIKSRTCDIFETDVIDFLWAGADFPKLIQDNEIKYTFEYGTLSENIVKQIVSELDGLYIGVKELKEEIDAGKTAGIMELQSSIENMYKKTNGENYKKNTLETETLIDPRDFISNKADEIDRRH